MNKLLVIVGIGLLTSCGPLLGTATVKELTRDAERGLQTRVCGMSPELRAAWERSRQADGVYLAFDCEAAARHGAE